MSNMMQQEQLHGSGESGYGVRLSGFYCKSQDFARRMKELMVPCSEAGAIAQSEVNGYLMFLRAESELPDNGTPVFIGTYRREAHRFFPDLPEFLRSLKAKSVVDMTLTESYGGFSLTLLYVPAPSLQETLG